MARQVPLHPVPLRADLRSGMRELVVAAALVMLLVDALILLPMLYARRPARTTDSGAVRRPPAATTPPSPNRGRLVRGFVMTASASLVVFLGAGLLGLPLWKMTLLGLLMWLPAYLSEAVWQYRYFGLYAVFSALAVLQLGHLSEHVVQNLQLLFTHGNLAASRGVFGQLDIETVHFFWNVTIWIVTGLLLYRFGTHNFWLWVAFAAASLHSVEHLYIYWLYLTDHPAYAAGGANGILAQGGLISSPLARPYLHLVYNVIEVVPFVFAFWQQSKLVYGQGRSPARSSVVGAHSSGRSVEQLPT